jgi:hypothetical protein
MAGPRHLVPKDNENEIVTGENIEKWANSGWIDLRATRVSYWQGWILKVKKQVQAFQNNSAVLPLDKNYQSLKEDDYGEVLAFIYSLQNGGRRVDFANAPPRPDGKNEGAAGPQE